MNYEYYSKVLALPIKSTMKGVLRTLVYHCNPKLDNLCIPSWDTIQSESGVSRDVINMTLKIFVETGLLEVRHRGDIQTGKKANEYFFNFDGLGLYKKSGKWVMPKEKAKVFKQQILVIKKSIEFENAKEGKKTNTAFSDKSTYQTTTINPDSELIESFNNPDTRPSYLQGSEGCSKSPDTRPINPDTRPEVIGQNKLQSFSTVQDSKILPCNEKNQKTVWHDKDINSVATIEHDSNKRFLAVNEDKPAEQTIDEWLSDYENG